MNSQRKAGQVVKYTSINIYIYSNTSSSGQLSFLDKMIGVFADEIDADRNSMTRIWELK